MTAAAVASAGTVGAVVASTAAFYGAGAAASALGTAAVAGTYAVAAGTAICGANRAVEAATGKNVIANTVFKGNTAAYEKVESAINVAAMGATSIASVYGGSSSQPKNNKNTSISTTKNAKSSNSVVSNSNNNKAYYQATSKESAKNIIDKGEISGKESRLVYAWTEKPTLKQVNNSGARSNETLVKFEVNSNTFERDVTVAKNLQKIAVVSTRPGPIKVYNPKEVKLK